MDKKAPTEFAKVLHLVVAKGIKEGVPLDFMVARLEIEKTDVANRYINQQTAVETEALAQQLADGAPKPGRKIILPPELGGKN